MNNHYEKTKLYFHIVKFVTTLQFIPKIIFHWKLVHELSRKI